MDTGDSFSNWIQALAESEVYLMLTSYAAQRIYAVALIGTAFAVAVWLGIWPLRKLHGETKYDTLLGDIMIPGPEPTRAESIAAQKARKLKKAKSYTRRAASYIAAAGILGVVVPLSLVLIIAATGSWFFPNAAVLMDRSTDLDILSPSPSQLVMFGLDILLKGGLNDFAEVFELSVTPISHVSNNWMFAFFVLAFRLSADVFVLALVGYSIRTYWNWRRVARDVTRQAAERMA